MVELSDPDYVMDLYAESVKMSTYLLAFIVSEFGSTHAKGIVVTQVNFHCELVQKSQWQRSIRTKASGQKSRMTKPSKIKEAIKEANNGNRRVGE